MDRTINLKLELEGDDKETLRQTMVLSNQVFDEIVKYGFEHHTHSKVSIHHETYYPIRKKHPELPCSILQGIRDVACEALKGVGFKKFQRVNHIPLFGLIKEFAASTLIRRLLLFPLSKVE